MYIKNMKIKSIACVVFSLLLSAIQAQSVVVDKVVGVVGKSLIKYSDVENQYLQYLNQGGADEPDIKCQIFEDLLVQKLMVTQAEVDSIEVSDAEVEQEFNSRIQYYISQVGSEEKLVEQTGKSIIEMKRDMWDNIREQSLMQRERVQIVQNISITPNEVKDYYNSLSKDSIPYVESEIELSQIVLYPKSSEEAIIEVRERLLNLRERINNGENFATLAVLYSEGPSAPRGGDIGWSSKGELDPAYAKAAMALKQGQTSKIVESDFGFHLIQLIERQGDRIHTRHILMKPKIPVEYKEQAINKIDRIVDLIHADSLSVSEAARIYSQDKNTALNGGKRVNPMTNTTKFALTDFESSEYYIIRKLSTGEMSEVYESTDENGKLVYKVIKITRKTTPHVANLKDDFDMLKQYAVQDKQDKIIQKWIEEKLKSTYVRIEEPYKSCEFSIQGWIKQ